MFPAKRASPRLSLAQARGAWRAWCREQGLQRFALDFPPWGGTEIGLRIQIRRKASRGDLPAHLALLLRIPRIGGAHVGHMRTVDVIRRGRGRVVGARGLSHARLVLGPVWGG